MTPAAVPTSRVGVVVIGRNEGQRLLRSLDSVLAQTSQVVYVDSCSSDGSADAARACGVAVAELTDPTTLSAARARNLGVDHITSMHPGVDLVQFVDGDCTVADGWLAAAEAVMSADSGVAAVCGWRLEDRPKRNVYHRISRLEWQMGAVGEVSDFAGEVMVRTDALERAGGYNPMVMAAEDTELSSRIRAIGGRIVRLDRVCSSHDINMDRFRQWWKRAERGGYGFTLVAELHRKDSKLFVKETSRALLWGGLAPLTGLALLKWTKLPLLAVAGKYALSTVRAGRGLKVADADLVDRAVWGLSCVFSSIPAFLGSVRYLRERVSGKRPRLQEYR